MHDISQHGNREHLGHCVLYTFLETTHQSISLCVVIQCLFFEVLNFEVRMKMKLYILRAVMLLVVKSICSEAVKTHVMSHSALASFMAFE